MRVGSLFSGIGGLELGLERAGMQVVWQCEIDPFCLKVLEKHWPGVKRYGDIRTVVSPEPVDLICGGFPCQPFSVAGKQRGKEDDRYLWPEMLRVIEEVRPTWVLGENVPGIINLALDTVLADLESIGYEAATFVIPACAVDAKHRRDRVWIMAHAKELRCSDGSHAALSEQRPPALIPDPRRSRQSGCCVANPDAQRQLQPQRGVEEQRGWTGHSGQDVGNSDSQHAQGQRPSGIGLAQARSGAGLPPGAGDGGERWAAQPGLGGMANGLSSWVDGHWPSEPDIPRVARGIPNRVGRLKALGNAVVPAVAEALGHIIMEADRLAGT